MAKNPVLLRLRDIRTAISHIEAAIDGKTLRTFKTDIQCQAAVERFVEKISEAVRHLPADMTSLHSDIPWKLIRGIGNILRHEYQNVSAPVIWETATAHIPELKVAINAMIKSQKSQRQKSKKRAS